MAGAPRLITAMLTGPVATNALKVALVVGTCLNAINQGSAIWHGVPVDSPRFALNYLVPYLVSSYSGAKMRTASGD